MLAGLMEKWNLVELNELTIVIRLLLAMICGGILGLERTRKKRPAGVRTYMLVCIGAATIMMTAQFMNQLWGGDVGRLPAQVISGIGFLGAGTIMVTKHYRILGLTTAAGLWASACIGLAIGIGFYFGGLVTTVVLMVIVACVDNLEDMYSRKLRRVHVYIILKDIVCLKSLIAYMQEKEINVANVELSSTSGVSGIGLYCVLKLPKTINQKEVLALITDYPDVIFVDRTDD